MGRPAAAEGAANVGWGFRTLFNQHEAVALLRQDDEDRYWHRVLTYCADHNLQAVLDEYAHYLVEGKVSRAPGPQSELTAWLRPWRTPSLSARRRSMSTM